MENNTDNGFTHNMAPAPARPQFLKVLCILTWICCGLTFVSSLSSLLMQPSAERTEKRLEKMRELNPEAAGKMEEVISSQTPGKRMANAGLNLVAMACSAYGALLMWKLKKQGFYLYIVGEVLPYLGFLFGGAAALSALGSMAGGVGSAMVGISIALMVIFDLAFIIMYGVNLKHMKN